MGKVLELIKNEELINFGQGLGSLYDKAVMGDRLFPDVKTKNLKAKYLQLAGQHIPTMANVHAFDAEAKIGSRSTLEAITVEKFLVKEKLNLSELEREYIDNGITESNELVEFIFNDVGNLAQRVKTRVEVAKMELLWNGKITIKENGLDYVIGDGLAHGVQTANWAADTADILGDIQTFVDLAKAKGQTINKCVTTKAVLACFARNKAIQTLLFSANGVGTYTDIGRINTLLSSMFGFTIELNDDIYQYEVKSGMTTAHYIPRNKFILYTSLPNGTAGACLWGTTPEERQQGIWTEKSSKQFITLTGWATPDPVVEWVKATGLAVPVMPNRWGHVVANVTTA